MVRDESRICSYYFLPQESVRSRISRVFEKGAHYCFLSADKSQKFSLCFFSLFFFIWCLSCFCSPSIFHQVEASVSQEPNFKAVTPLRSTLGPAAESSQEAHGSDLQVKASAGFCGRQVLHVHYREQVWVLALEDEVCLMPASIFDLKMKMTQI